MKKISNKTPIQPITIPDVLQLNEHFGNIFLFIFFSLENRSFKYSFAPPADMVLEDITGTSSFTLHLDRNKNEICCLVRRLESILFLKKNLTFSRKK